MLYNLRQSSTLQDYHGLPKKCHFITYKGPKSKGLALDCNADVNTKSEYQGYTPLIQAAENGHLEIVKLLLQHNADVNTRKKDGDTALTAAIVAPGSYKDIVEVLLQQNADVNVQVFFFRSNDFISLYSLFPNFSDCFQKGYK